MIIVTILRRSTQTGAILTCSSELLHEEAEGIIRKGERRYDNLLAYCKTRIGTNIPRSWVTDKVLNGSGIPPALAKLATFVRGSAEFCGTTTEQLLEFEQLLRDDHSYCLEVVKTSLPKRMPSISNPRVIEDADVGSEDTVDEEEDEREEDEDGDA